MVNSNELIIFFIFFPLLIILIQVCCIYLFKFNLLKSFVTSFIITDIVFLFILIFSIKLTFINSLFYLFFFFACSICIWDICTHPIVQLDLKF
jgi:hypothetical protein